MRVFDVQQLILQKDIVFAKVLPCALTRADLWLAVGLVVLALSLLWRCRFFVHVLWWARLDLRLRCELSLELIMLIDLPQWDESIALNLSQAKLRRLEKLGLWLTALHLDIEVSLRG